MADAVAPPLSPIASSAETFLVPSAETSSPQAGGQSAKLSSGIDQLIAMLRPYRASEGYRSEDGASEASVGRPAAGGQPARPDPNHQGRIMTRDLFPAGCHASSTFLQARTVLQRHRSHATAESLAQSSAFSGC